MECKLEDVVNFKNGKKKPNSKGNIPIYGGNGILGYTLHEKESILCG